MKYNVDHAFKQDENGSNVTVGGVAQPGSRLGHTRRLAGKVLVAFHQACDAADLEIAGRLLKILEIMLTQRAPHPQENRQRSIAGLVAGHDRLWHLRQPPAD